MKITKFGVRNLAVVASMVSIAFVTATMAYFSSSDTVTNKFTVANGVKVEITESNYTDSQTVAFDQIIKKNPKIKNVDDTDAVVFMKVTLPMIDTSSTPITLINANGTKGTTYSSGNLSVFNYISSGDGRIENIGADSSTFQYDSNWILIDDSTPGTYLFGYKTRVNVGEETASPLFDKVQYKSILERNIANGTKEEIKIEAYAVQADNLTDNEGNKIPTENDDGKIELDEATLKKIYEIYDASK